jgi:hypothetical protein
MNRKREIDLSRSFAGLLFSCACSASSCFLFHTRVLLLPEEELELRHAHLLAAEFDAFHFQAKPLIQAAFSGDCDPAPGSYYAMPGKSVRLAQCADNETRTARNSGRAGDCPIAGDMAARDLQDGGADLCKQWVGPSVFGHDGHFNQGRLSS